MEWIDEWLAGAVHRSAALDLAERSRHERFVVARTVSALVALVALPPYLIARSVPTALECLALLALAAPLAAVFVLSRFGSMAVAQAMVSLTLAPFVAGAVVAFGGPASAAVLAFLVVPLDALLCGSRRAVLVATIVAILGVPLAAAAQAGGILTGHGAALATVFTVAATLGFGHIMAQVAGDRRLKSLLRSALRAGETREGASLQAIDDLVTWHDRNGSVLRANAAATKLLGASPTSLQGRGLFSRIHVADRPAFLKAISDAAHGAEPVVAQIRLQVGEAPNAGSPVPARLGARPQGGLIWIEMRAHRLLTEEGCAVVAVSRDISEHKQHAEDLDALLREAETAGETRAGLLSTVSHELRVPLNAIIGYSEMLMGKGGPALASLRGDQRQDYAEIIHRSGQHMLGVVSTLLDLSTIEAGHYGLSPEPIEVAELVEDCCRLISLSADRSGVTLAQDIAPGLPELRADRRACQQILINLLSNAVKFTPKGGLVTVQARRDGNRIVLAVRDTGVGVCAAELPRLGDPFYKGASGRNPAEKGSGLGLSVVRGLVGLHDGQISIASAPGNGTTVTVGLPIDAGHPARVAAPAKVHTFVRSADGAHHQDRMTKLA